MSQLNLDLPPMEPNHSTSSKGSGVPLINGLALVAALAAAVGTWMPRSSTEPQKNIDVQIDAVASDGDFNQELLLKLKNASAYRKAAEHLGLAIANKDLSPARKAKLLKERGDFYALDDNHQQALSDYYLAEILIKGNDEEKSLARDISQAIIETLRLMGQYSAVSDELNRKNRERQGESGTVSDPIVATVDGVGLKMSDFRTKVEKMIQHRIQELKSQGLDPEKEAKMTESIRKQFSGPFEQLNFLNQWVLQEIIYREALAWKFDQHSEYKSAVADFKRRYLSNMFIQDKLSIKDVSDLDLKNYAEANKAKLGLSTEAGALPQAAIDSAKDKILAAYKEEKTKELQQEFQAEMLKRHQVEIKDDAFSEGAK